MLLNLHSTCCALRSSRDLDIKLSSYHLLVLDELYKRNISNLDASRHGWGIYNYCGKKRGYVKPCDKDFQQLYLPARDNDVLIYKEHNANWMSQCLRKLKHIELIGASVEELMLKEEISGGCR